MTRRQWLGLLTSLGLFGAASRGAGAAQPEAKAPSPRVEPLLLTDAQWRQRLAPEQYNVLRQEGTERPGSSPLDQEKRRGTYHCARCGGHQGHIFDDGPRPTGLRYCNNGVALRFVPEAG